MVTQIRSGAVDGLEGLAVTVEVDVRRGLPTFQLVGLPNAAVRESRERVLAAIRNSGFAFPKGRVTVNLAPADVRKQGASFDLAIALGVIAAQAEGEPAGGCDHAARREALFLGELSLDGRLRPVRGLLAIVLDAAARGDRTVVVPAEQKDEASLARGVEVVPAADLAGVVKWWQTGAVPVPGIRDRQSVLERRGSGREERSGSGVHPIGAMTGLIGQPLARRAAFLAAAGRHNLLLTGPPGTGKTRLARAVGALQPPLTPTESLEVTRIQSAAGLLQGGVLQTVRPLRAPHHTVTRAGLVGGGSGVRPGEVTLAHRGILFLDEVAEFAPAVLDALRQPLEAGEVTVARCGRSHRFPADFQLVAAMNPCRCGYLGSPRRDCRCLPSQVAQYRGRISGPLLDRFDLFVVVGDLEAGLLSSEREPPGDQTLRQVARAWSALKEWRERLNVTCEDPRRVLNRLGLTSQATAFLEEARQRLGLSLRGVLRCARVARTVATLAGQSGIAQEHVAEALNFRLEVWIQEEEELDAADPGQNEAVKPSPHRNEL